MLALLPALLAAALGAGYVALARRARPWPWPLRRTACFLGGVALLVVALSPPFARAAHHDLGVHAAQHLLVAMVAPFGLVLGMPGTLLLRGLPRSSAVRLGRALSSRPVHVLLHPAVALLLNSGGLLLLYLTPLVALAHAHPAVHLLVQLHVVLAGTLFAWVVAGLEPSAARSPLRTRLVVVAVAVAVHATVSQLMYAGALPHVHAPLEQARAAASLMYFAGDLTEVALALLAVVLGRDDHPTRRTPSSRLPHPPPARATYWTSRRTCCRIPTAFRA